MPAQPRHLPPLAAYCTIVAAMLAGCGGGSGNEAPPATSKYELTFTAPSEADNVHTVGTPVRLQLSATLDGAAVRDGTAVALQAAHASFSPVQPVTSGGQAVSSLSATQPGELELLAQVSAPQATTGSARRTLHIRPQPQPLELLVPAYFSPGPDSHWNKLASGAQAYPSVAITAILNPNNGIFSTEDPLLTAALEAFRRSGGKVLGYVYTRYGNGSRTIADIQRNIDSYRSIYGTQLDGFFLDEMHASGERLAFYRTLFEYIKAMDPKLRVVGNPGIYPVADYADVADALVSFEGQAGAYAGINPQPANTWIYRRGNGAQAALVHDATGCSAMQDALRLAQTPQRNTGLVYVTDRHYDFASNTGNPWAALPSYWDQMLATVAAINAGRALPGC